MGAFAQALQLKPPPAKDASGVPWSFIGKTDPVPEATRQHRGEYQSGEVYTEATKYLEGINLAKQEVQRITKRSDLKFSILSGFYVVRNPLAVQDFLVEHRALFGLLFAALPKVKETWGNDAKAQLELLYDPEDESSSLVVHVSSNHPDSYSALDHFDESWWLNNISASEGLLNFSVEP